MTKTLSISITIAAAILGIAASALPSQAATRLMTSSVDGFEYRCERHGGLFDQNGAMVSCQTPSVPVACEFTGAERADCVWPGVAHQIDVIRVIGTLAAIDAPSSSGNPGNVGKGGGNGGGGFQGPKDIKDAPNDDPKPNFDGPKDLKLP